MLIIHVLLAVKADENVWSISCDEIVKKVCQMNLSEEIRVENLSIKLDLPEDSSNIHGFSFKNQIMNFLPSFASCSERFLKGIFTLKIVNMELKEIHALDLQNFPFLMSIDFSNNLIEILEENLFNSTPYLQFIHMENNKIRSIFPGIFDKINQLGYLGLRNNICINSDFDTFSVNLEDNNTYVDRNLMKKFVDFVDVKCSNYELKIFVQNLVEKIADLRNESETIQKNLKIDLESQILQNLELTHGLEDKLSQQIILVTSCISTALFFLLILIACFFIKKKSQLQENNMKKFANFNLKNLSKSKKNDSTVKIHEEIYSTPDYEEISMPSTSQKPEVLYKNVEDTEINKFGRILDTEQDYQTVFDSKDGDYGEYMEIEAQTEGNFIPGDNFL